jgi:hypothetical protein
MKGAINFEKLVIREQISSRGGGIEISLNTLGFEGQKMTAYQNYLGGGMLGAIGSDCTVKNWESDKKLLRISDKLMRYFHTLTNHDYDDYEGCSFEQNQKRSLSAY